jgi:hypothetical protein
MRRARPLALRFAVALCCVLAACADKGAMAPETVPPLPAEAIAPLQVALDDARARLLPGIDPSLGTPLAGALDELDRALMTGQVGRLELAVARTGSTLSHDALDPDGAAVQLLLGRIEDALNAHQEIH